MPSKPVEEEISLESMHEQTTLINKHSNKKWIFFCNNKQQSRHILVGQKNHGFTTNAINNQKYNFFTFIPLVLYNQFKFFLNLYFLIVALTQFINQVKIGYLYTYWGPLCFVLLVTMIREAIDDFRRHQRDKEVNSALYIKANTDSYYQQDYVCSSFKTIKSADIKVGDIIIVKKNQRIPADVILLKTSEPNGSCFIKTDQLDGETDWKARKAIPYSQSLPLFTANPIRNLNNSPTNILNEDGAAPADYQIVLPRRNDYDNQGNTAQNAFSNTNLDTDDYHKINICSNSGSTNRFIMKLTVEPPRKDIHTFSGIFTAQSVQSNIITSCDNREESYTTATAASNIPKLVCKENLDIEYTMWSSCVLASEGYVWGLVIYTGRDTRSCMNTSQPRSKVGLTDLEINRLTKILFVSVITLSVLLMVLKGFSGPWYRYFVRFILLFSYIIPISLRVNLDLAKMAYAYMIMKDKELPGNVVRNTTIPEELGRIRYLFTDKTGTLTKNQMKFKRVYLGQSGRSFWNAHDSETAEIGRQLKLAEATYLYRRSMTGNATATASTNIITASTSNSHMYTTITPTTPTPTTDMITSGSTLSSYPGGSAAFAPGMGSIGFEHQQLSSASSVNTVKTSTNALNNNNDISNSTNIVPKSSPEIVDYSNILEDDLYETIKAICICNNVTPIFSEDSTTHTSNSDKLTRKPMVEKLLSRHKGLKKADKNSPLLQQQRRVSGIPKLNEPRPTTRTDTGGENNNFGPVSSPAATVASRNQAQLACCPIDNRNSLSESMLSNSSTCDSTSHLIIVGTSNGGSGGQKQPQTLDVVTPSSSSSTSSNTANCTSSSSVGSSRTGILGGNSAINKPDNNNNNNSKLNKTISSYQASSPDEVALVSWAKKVGMKLIHRDTNSLTIKTPLGRVETFRILKMIPFTSERKMMGIFVRDENTGSIFYYIKGADNVISKMANLAAAVPSEISGESVLLPHNLIHRNSSASPTPYNTVTAGGLKNKPTPLPSSAPKYNFKDVDLVDLEYHQMTEDHVDFHPFSFGNSPYDHPLGTTGNAGSSDLLSGHHLRKRSDGLDLYTQNVYDWIEEESGNLAQEGLRTLAIARMGLTLNQYTQFAGSFESRRHEKETLSSLIPSGTKFDVLGVTGVEDKLQDGVPNALEIIRNAGIKIWMLTGDKLETALCIALSSHLLQRNQPLFVFQDTYATQQSTSSYTNLNKTRDFFDVKSVPVAESRLKDRIFRELTAYRSLKQTQTPIVMTGPILEVCLKHYEREFIEAAIRAHCVIICRASPTQKSHVVHVIPKYYDRFQQMLPNPITSPLTSTLTAHRRHRHITTDTYSNSNATTSSTAATAVESSTSSKFAKIFQKCFCCCGGNGKSSWECKDILGTSMTKCVTCAIGDGGNDVSMIQMAHVGVGIVGKEGKQASLAADFSITQFSHLTKLILVHGRYSYKRTAALSQFVIHRGLIISVMQAIFSAMFFFASIALYQGYLMIGYATIYTMFPVFSIILDRDVSPQIAMTYPELYKELVKGRALSFKTFYIWVLISTYQGSVIMFGAFLLFEDEFVHVVSITFTALILNELLMVSLTVRRWRHWAVITAEMFSLAVYLLSLVIFRNYYFDRDFVLRSSLTFVWKVCAVTVVSCVPLVLIKILARKIAPPIYAKLG